MVESFYPLQYLALHGLRSCQVSRHVTEYRVEDPKIPHEINDILVSVVVYVFIEDMKTLLFFMKTKFWEVPSPFGLVLKFLDLIDSSL